MYISFAIYINITTSLFARKFHFLIAIMLKGITGEKVFLYTIIHITVKNIIICIEK